MLVAQPAWAQVVQVTSVQLKPTPSGLEVILQTSDGATPQVFTSNSGKAFVADIANAQLRLPQGNEFRANNPAEGIAEVTVTNLNANSIQVRVIGAAAVPKVEVFESDEEGLILSLTPVQEPQQRPEEQPAQEQQTPEAEPEEQPTQEQQTPEAEPEDEPSQEQQTPETEEQPDAQADESEEIEVVVTATRTAEEVTNVPRSVTVINREQIQQQTRSNRNLNDILANTVPGFSPPTNRSNTFGQTLRGRNVSVLIDGVPQNSNLRSIPSELTSIDPNAIERIEVVRGPNAIYGAQATGGVINIITRRPSEDRLTSTTEVGTSPSLTHSEDSFGYNLQHSISGTEDQFDYTASFSIATTGGFFDAEGDRISQSGGLEDTTFLNGLLKFGVDLDDQQRLQLSFNHYDQQQDTDFVPDESIEDIPGIQKARARRLPEGTTVIGGNDGAFLRNTVANLSYTHENIFGSRVQAQAYYRNNDFQGSFPIDDRNGFTGLIYASPGESENFGGRLQIETPLSQAETLSLLWGVDYNNERSSQTFDVFDPVELDASGGRVYRKIEDRTFVPRYKLDDLGLFAQLQWDVTDSLQLSGGVRYVSLGLNVDDYTTFDDIPIEGGERNFNDTVFNAGIVHNFTDELSLFANFAQGFSVPDIGSVLRLPPSGFVNVEDSIQLTEPQKVDNYEIGIRGEWSSVQASLAAFYNFSDLGLDFRVTDELIETVRAPQRVYGVEASIDVQPGRRWQFGGTFTWLEGENDEDEDGEYLALNSITVPPLKLTAYIENETLPGWRNRLQLLYSGNRDRAFEDEVDLTDIESYVTVDYISSIRIGSGELQIGVQNLFNNQYFPVYSQYFAPFFEANNYAGRGRTLSVNYRITW